MVSGKTEKQRDSHLSYYEDTTGDEDLQKHPRENRNVLKEFLGDANINHCRVTVITLLCVYSDNKLMDIDHLCCLAHARAKFKYAFDQGKTTGKNLPLSR